MDINKEIKESMLNKDSERTAVLRSIKTAFTNFEKEGKTLTETDQLKILLKLKSQREDSINQFRAAGRDELVQGEQKELDILLEYIPKQPTDEEIKDLTQKIINRMKNEGLEISMKQMKNILFEVQVTYPTANGGIVSSVLKSNL